MSKMIISPIATIPSYCAHRQRELWRHFPRQSLGCRPRHRVTVLCPFQARHMRPLL